MSTARHRLLGLVVLLTFASDALGNAFVRGAYYRLGEDDTGAANGALGADPTKDAFLDALHLARYGSPHYSTNVPAGYAASKLSMAFANVGLGGPSILGFYGRTTSLPVDQGYALEAWANSPTVIPTLEGPIGAVIASRLVAYNGTPGTDGFGFYEGGGNYYARIGKTDHLLGSAPAGGWHHLAFVQSFGTAGYYFDGKLVEATTKDPLPVTPTGGFWIGGHVSNADSLDLFNGYVDEVRYQTFNPIAAGAFEPTAFLIDTPEPSSALPILMAAGVELVRRRRRR